MEWVEQPGMHPKKLELTRLYDHEIPKTFLKDILEYLNMNENSFWKIIEKHRNPKIWEKSSSGEWKLKVKIN